MRDFLEEAAALIDAVAILFAVALLISTMSDCSANMRMTDARSDAPHHWFAWHPVRLQGGQPIPTVQQGGRVVWLKTIERFRFFDHWVYREIGDARQLPY